MSLNLRIVLTSFSFCALLGSSAANGETVLKLSLGNTGPDLAMDAGGVLGTTSDGNAGTTGDQNTAIDYTGFLDPLFVDGTGSFSVAGLQRTGNPSIIGGALIVQDFFGGTFNLYDPANSLLLSGNLQDSTLTGVIGGTGTGSIFTTKVGTFTSGSLLPVCSAKLSQRFHGANKREQWIGLRCFGLTLYLTGVYNGRIREYFGRPRRVVRSRTSEHRDCSARRSGI